MAFFFLQREVIALEKQDAICFVLQDGIPLKPGTWRKADGCETHCSLLHNIKTHTHSHTQKESERKTGQEGDREGEERERECNTAP